MRATSRQFAVICFCLAWLCGHGYANPFFGPVADPNASGGGFSFSNPDLRASGLYVMDDSFVDPVGDNDVLRVSTGFHQFGVHSATMAVHISNGENGNDGDDPLDPDTFNFEPPHSEFSVINSPGMRLQNGNVVRFSFWIKADPESPIEIAPSAEPVVSIEYWTEALSNDQDSTVFPNPQSGDRVFDTQVNGQTAVYLDVDGDGVVNGHLTDGAPPDFTLNNNWMLVSIQHEVDDTNWGYDLPGGFVSKTVNDVEEIRAKFTVQERLNTDLTDGGAFFIDQPMVEIFKTMADVPASIPNPQPGLGGVDADFDDDLSVDCSDVDALVAEMVSGNDDPAFDLTGDGIVDEADLNEWLAQAGMVNLASQNPYLKGDANLDGVADDLDFDIWNANRFSNQPAFCSGDFNGDGAVDLTDLHLWNEVKFTSSGDNNVVPEPTFYLPLMFVFPLVLGKLRRSASFPRGRE